MIPIGMSTTCVFPYGLERSFAMAKEAGFDGIEVMVLTDRGTQTASTLLGLSAKYELPILSIHAPGLFVTQFVWGRDPQNKLDRSAALAAEVGAKTVVVHPPYVWQRAYAPTFVRSVRETATRHGVEVAVENMFPWRVAGGSLGVYNPGIDPTAMDVDAMTLDFSHAAMAGRDGLEMAMKAGDRLRHIHLCDSVASSPEGTGADKHMVPGRGGQPVAETLQMLADAGWTGQLVAEIHTHTARTYEKRMALLRETVEFARAHTIPAAAREDAARDSVSDPDPTGVPEGSRG